MGVYSGRYNLEKMMASLTPEQKYKVIKLLKDFKTDMDNYRIGKKPMPKKFMYKYKDEILKFLSESDPDLNSFGRRKDQLLKKQSIISKSFPDYNVIKHKNDIDYLRATGRSPKEFFRNKNFIPGYVDVEIDRESGSTVTVPHHIAKKYYDAENLLYYHDGKTFVIKDGDISEYRKRKQIKPTLKIKHKKSIKRCKCK